MYDGEGVVRDRLITCVRAEPGSFRYGRAAGSPLGVTRNVLVHVLMTASTVDISTLPCYAWRTRRIGQPVVTGVHERMHGILPALCAWVHGVRPSNRDWQLRCYVCNRCLCPNGEVGMSWSHIFVIYSCLVGEFVTSSVTNGRSHDDVRGPSRQAF